MLNLNVIFTLMASAFPNGKRSIGNYDANNIIYMDIFLSEDTNYLALKGTETKLEKIIKVLLSWGD